MIVLGFALVNLSLWIIICAYYSAKVDHWKHNDLAKKLPRISDNSCFVTGDIVIINRNTLFELIGEEDRVRQLLDAADEHMEECGAVYAIMRKEADE